MKRRFWRQETDADITALRLEHFSAVLETLLVFAVFYLIQQLLATQDFFERTLAMPGTVGHLSTHLGWIVATVLGLFALPLFLRWFVGSWTLPDFGFRTRPGRRDVALAAYLGCLLGFWFAIGFALRPEAVTGARALLTVRDPADAVVYILYVAPFVAALRGEFFYRGYVQNLLMREYGISWGTLLGLIFFCFSFFWIGWTHVAALLLPTGFGAAILFNRRRSVWGPFIYHALVFVLGFAAFALLELTRSGYTLFTAGLGLAVVLWTMRMIVPLQVLWRDIKRFFNGLRSNWIRNGIIAVSYAGAVLLLWRTAHTNLQAHTVFTVILAAVCLIYKLSQRYFELRRVLEY